MSSKIAHLGEFSDDCTYTHHRVAQILQRDPDWVLDNLIYPTCPNSGDGRPGVAHAKIGTYYLMTGESIRLFIETLALPRLRPGRKAK